MRARSPTSSTGAVAPPIYQTSTYAQMASGSRARLRVRADPEPDPGAARAGRRGLRAVATGSRLRAGWWPRPRSLNWPPPARRSWSATTSTAGRSVTSSASTGRRDPGMRAPSTWPAGPEPCGRCSTSGPALSRSSRRRRNPLLQDAGLHIPRARRRRPLGSGRAQAGRPPSPAGRPQHVRLARAAATAPAGRGRSR